MELRNINNPEFLKISNNILEKVKMLLFLVRYPNQAGNKDFFFIESEATFQEFLASRSVKESVTLFRHFDLLFDGILYEEYIQEILDDLTNLKSANWLIITFDDNSVFYDWYFVDNRNELFELVQEHTNRRFIIIAEPDWFKDDEIIHVYVPDYDRVIRPGSY